MTNMGRDGFAVRRTVTGLGLFTLRPIGAGKRILEYTGVLVPVEEIEGSRKKYFFEVDERRALDGSDRRNIARYINHSCRPNAKAYSSTRGRVWIWSIKNIKAGEEITINYGRDYFDEHIKPKGCKCRKCSAEREGRSANDFK